MEYCGEIKVKEAEDVRYQKDKNFDWIQSLKLIDGKHCSPIDICYKEAKFVDLFDLQWHHYEVPPSKMKLTNTGRSLILSGEWMGYMPYLKDGALKGKNVFAQMHFLWSGGQILEGSEHTIDGKRYPLEIHFVHFRKDFVTLERALRVPGGVVIIVHMYGIAFHQNENLEQLLEHIKNVREADTETCIQPLAMKNFISPFQGDYFVYWGKKRSAKCEHIVQWLFPRKTHSVSLDQLRKLRLLMNPNLISITRNWRRTPDKTRQTLFLVNSSTRVLGSTWLQTPLSKITLHPTPAMAPKLASGLTSSSRMSDILQILNSVINRQKITRSDMNEQMQETEAKAEIQVKPKGIIIKYLLYGVIWLLWINGNHPFELQIK